MKQVMDGYIRVSRVMGREGDSYISPSVQREAIERWASYKDVTIGEWLVDEDQSGGSQDRPDLKRGVERAIAGETAGIISWKIDRFSRTTEGGLRDLRRLQEANARLAFVVEDIDTETVYGRMIYAILLAVSEAFLEGIKASWITAKGRAIDRGVHIGPIPYGYVRGDDGRLTPDPEKAALVTEAFRLAALRGIRAAQDYLAAHDDSREWVTTQVRRILSNDVYLGRVRQLDRYAPDEHAHQALTDRRIWEAAQDEPARRAPTAEFPLSGVLICAECGQHMVGARGGKGQRTYRCSGGLARAKNKCSAPANVSAHIVEPYVIGEAQKLAARFTVTIGQDPDLDDLELAISLARQELDAFVGDLTMRRVLGDRYHAQLALRADAVTTAENAYRDACKTEAKSRSYTPDDLANDPEVLRSFLAGVYVIKVRRGRNLTIDDRVSMRAVDADGQVAEPAAQSAA